MKKSRTSYLPILLLVGALILGILSSCVANTTLVIGADGETQIVETEAPEASGNGSFQYALNEAGYYEITGYTPNGTNVVDIVVPSVIDDIAVTSIADRAFYYCTYLRSITIPDSVTVVGNYAFAGCTYLETVTLPDTVKTMGEGMFANCVSLKSVKLPADMAKIPNHTFSGCTSLEEFTITDAMTEIGNGAFRDCTALKSVTIHENVTRIGAQAYYNCSALTYFEINANLDFILMVDEDGNPVYDENGIRQVDSEQSTLGAYMLYRFSPDIEIVYDEENNLGMAAYYAHYELDKEPPSLTTETETLIAPSN